METVSYYLRDLGDGNGTFVRLDNPLILKTGYIISFGDSHMFIQISENYSSNTSQLDIKFLDGPKTDQTFSFGKSNPKTCFYLVILTMCCVESEMRGERGKVVKIGRMNDCDIKFNSKGLSR